MIVLVAVAAIAAIVVGCASPGVGSTGAGIADYQRTASKCPRSGPATTVAQCLNAALQVYAEKHAPRDLDLVRK